MSRYGRMRASFDSESSLVPSPPLSPSRHGHPVYFVQSPSRESTTHDIDSLSQSFSRATPRESPMASPMHKHFKNGSSGSTSFNMATAPKPGSRRVLPHAGAGGAGAAHKKGGYNRAWAPGTILEEEGPEEETKKSLSRCCIFLIAVLFSVAVFFIGALVFWLVTMPHKPKVTVQVPLRFCHHSLYSEFCYPLISTFRVLFIISLPSQKFLCFEAAFVHEFLSHVCLYCLPCALCFLVSFFTFLQVFFVELISSLRLSLSLLSISLSPICFSSL